MFGKKLVTPQTGAAGKVVNRVYVEEASDIESELYLSCLIDRSSSMLAFSKLEEWILKKSLKKLLRKNSYYKS